MHHTARPTRANRTSPVDFQHAATSLQRLGEGQACGEGVLACLLSRGLPLTPKAPWSRGGGLTRPAHSLRGRLEGGAPLAAPGHDGSCGVARRAPLPLARAPEAAGGRP
jgi:hypothetical protein